MPARQLLSEMKGDALIACIAGGFVALASADALTPINVQWKTVLQAPSGGTQSKPAYSSSTSSFLAASSARRNGSGVPIVSDPETGSWLAVAGTWFHESGTTEPEDLLHRYLKCGAENLTRELDGFFAIIVADARSQQIVAITDVIGSLHLYYRVWQNAVGLSTSSLALASLSPVTLDALGCQEFIQAGVMYEDRTFYNEIRKLPPAAITTFCNGRLKSQRRYWSVASLDPESLPAQKSIDLLWEQLGGAVRRISRQFTSIACDLTGGYDSRVVTAALFSHRRDFSTVVSGAADSADVLISQELSAQLGLAHLHYPPSDFSVDLTDLDRLLELTDGECDLTDYYNVAEIHNDLSRQFDISLNGSFGEVARGYWWELLFPHTGSRRKLDSCRLAFRRYAPTSCGELFHESCRVDFVRHMQEVIERTTVDVEHHPNTFQMDTVYLCMRMQRWQGRLASATNRIWPCLSPFMFRGILETMLQSRFDVRSNSLLVRRMLASYAEPIAAFPLETGHPALPANWKTILKFRGMVPHLAGKMVRKIRSRFMQPQPDQRQNMRMRLAQSEMAREFLDPNHMRSMPILDETAVRNLTGAAKHGLSGPSAEWSRLLTLELALAHAAAANHDLAGALPQAASPSSC